MCRPLHRLPLSFLCLFFLASFSSVVTAQPPEVTNLTFLDPILAAWDPLSGTAGYHIYRGDLSALQAGDYGTCLLGSWQGTVADLPDDPGPGNGFFYLVGAYDPNGPGSLGNATSGMARTPAGPCIGNRRYNAMVPGTSPDGIPSRESLRNPAIEEWSGTREWTGVVLQSGEFTLMAIDAVGGAPKDDGAEAVKELADGGAKSFPDTGIGASIAINVVTTETRAAIGTGATVEGETGTLGASSRKKAAKKKSDKNEKTSTDKPEKEKAGTESTAELKKKVAKKKPDKQKTEKDSGIEKPMEELKRYYRSQVDYDGPLGHGWDFPANSRIESAAGDVLWYDGTGRRFVFYRTSPTAFVSPMGFYGRLFDEGSHFILRFPDGRIRQYRAFDGSSTQGALEFEEDLDGNRLSLLYDHQGLLTSIIDDLGREAVLGYDAEGRLDTVTDFEGRTVQYGYDPAGDLVSVRSPVVVGTPNGNDFPLGKTTLYTYSGGNSDDRLNHNLLTIVSPNESGSPIPFLENLYEQDPNSFEVDRVMAQTIGGTGSDGVPAGGVLAFSYVPLNIGGDPLDMTLPRREVTVHDRNGNERSWILNVAGNPLSLTERTNRGLRPGEPDYTTSATYNNEGEMTALLLPEGNEISLTYDNPGADRYREGNVLELRLIAGPRGDGHGGGLADIVSTYSYDPLGRRIGRLTDSQGRQMSWTFDYQEGDPSSNGVADLATRFLIDTSGVAFNLGDLNGDGTVLQAGGHPVMVEWPTVTLQPGSNQAIIQGDTTQEVVTMLTWNDHGQLVAVRDPEENVHLLSYYPELDPDGDGLSTPPPPDGRILDTAEGGYLESIAIDIASSPGRDNGTDPPPANLIFNYSYDHVGNRISEVDVRGVRTTRIFNQLDQVVELRLASATRSSSGPHGDPATGRGESGLTPFGYRLFLSYDANDNLVERQIEDVGGGGAAGPYVETRWTHDILDNLTSEEQEVSTGTFVTTRLRYDANENLDERIWPMGNTDVWAWDERDLLLLATRGATGPLGGAASTRLFEYGGNGGTTRVTDGRGGMIDLEYDGADRLVRRIDQVGNTAEWFHDSSGNVTGQVLRGPVGGPAPPDRSGAANVDLSVTNYSYDDLNRLVRKDQWLDVVSGAPPVRLPVLTEGTLDPGDGAINQIYEYDRLSRMTFGLSDTGSTTRYDYDGAGRLAVTTDPAGNTREWTWDGNGNPIELVETENPSSPGPPAEIFLTTWFYDALDRLTMEVDNVGQTRRWEHDSLGLVQVETDPLGPPGGTLERRSPAYSGLTVPVNAHGNVIDYEYDGAGRLTAMSTILTVSGEGDGTTAPTADTSNPANADGLLTTITVWDDNSLPVACLDDGGHTTSYEYDNLNRLTLVGADDGTQSVYVYDGEDNLTQKQSPDGSTITWTWDAGNRPIEASVIPAPGVTGSTLQIFEYDGLSRPTLTHDINEPLDPNDDVVVSFTYDSLGRIVEEHLTIGPAIPLTTTNQWLAESLRTSLITPSSIQTDYSYDGANRLELVTGGPMSALFEYFGRTRVHTIHHGNGARATMLDDAGSSDIGYDGARRVTLLRHLDPNNLLLGGYEYRHDRADNRVSALRQHHVDPNGFVGDLYEYDSAGRLVSFQEAVLDPAHAPVSPPSAVGTWQLDGAGSWAIHESEWMTLQNTPNNNNEYDEPQSGGTRVDDGLTDDFCDVATTGPADGLNLRHDLNGNQIHDGASELHYDAFGRMVGSLRTSGPPASTGYLYDALGRRVRRVVTGYGSLDEVRNYLYSGTGVIEEQDAGGIVTRSAAPGREGRGETLWQILGSGDSHYYIPDAHGSTVALMDGASPVVLERVMYRPWGFPVFLDAGSLPITDPNSGAPVARSTLDNPTLFAGMRYDPELSTCLGWSNECRGVYHSLHRYYSPFQGRFLSRDPLGAWADPTAAGNGYLYAGGNPVNLRDPLGLGPGDVDVDMPAGPIIRLEGTDMGLEIMGQTLSGDFAFERADKPPAKPDRPKPRASNVPASIGPSLIKPDEADEFEIMFNPEPLTIKKTVPWEEQRREHPPSSTGGGGGGLSDLEGWSGGDSGTIPLRPVVRRGYSLHAHEGGIPVSSGNFYFGADRPISAASYDFGADRTISAASYDFQKR